MAHLFLSRSFVGVFLAPTSPAINYSEASGGAKPVATSVQAAPRFSFFFLLLPLITQTLALITSKQWLVVISERRHTLQFRATARAPARVNQTQLYSQCGEILAKQDGNLCHTLASINLVALTEVPPQRRK